MARGPGWTINRASAIATPRARASRGSGSSRTNDDGASVTSVTGAFSMRPGPRWSFSVSPYYDRVTEPQQYVSTLSGGRPVTFDNRYVFAFIDRSTMSMEFRLGLTLKPDINLDVYAEPFAASGRYYDYGELLEPGSRERLKYGTNGSILTVNPDGSQVVNVGGSTFTLRNRDFNTLSFRSNVVLRWEWRTGSTLYVVWQQDRSGTETVRHARGRGRCVSIGHRARREYFPRQDVVLDSGEVNTHRTWDPGVVTPQADRSAQGSRRNDRPFQIRRRQSRLQQFLARDRSRGPRAAEKVHERLARRRIVKHRSRPGPPCRRTSSAAPSPPGAPTGRTRTQRRIALAIAPDADPNPGKNRSRANA